MRRGLSAVVGFVVVLSAASAAAADAGSDASTSKDSGISTTPSPSNPTVPAQTADSGTTETTSSDTTDEGGCSLVSHRDHDGWSASLGLVAAAALFGVSRRRRARR
jgi:hypothetical protein